MSTYSLPGRGERLLLAALLIASLIPIWSVTYFPSQNGPGQLLTVKMMHDYGNPSFNYSEYYTRSWHLIPHLSHTLVVYLLAFVFPLLIANKIALSLYAILLPLSVFYFLSYVDPRKRFAGYIAFLMVYNLPLMRGYHDYSLGVPITIFALTYWLQNRHHFNPRKIIVLTGLVLLVYTSHIFNLFVLGFLMAAFAFHETKNPIKTVAMVVPFFVPALLFLADFVLLNLRGNAWINTSELVYTRPHQVAEGFFSRYFYTMSFPAYLLAMIPLFFLARLLWPTLRETYQQCRAEGLKRSLRNPYLVIWGLLLIAYGLTPYKFLGWHYVNIRFVPFVVLMTLACVAPAPARSMRSAFVAVTGLAAIGVYTLLTVQFVRANRLIEEYVSGIEKVERNRVLLPLAFEGSRIGQIYPTARTFEYYQIARGGANGQGLAKYNTTTPLWYKSYPVKRRFPPWNPAAPSKSIERIAEVYDYVLFWSTDPELIRRLREARFRLVHKQGRLQIYRNEKSGLLTDSDPRP